jgi:capsular polysaccharide biosynthesis protein
MQISKNFIRCGYFFFKSLLGISGLKFLSPSEVYTFEKDNVSIIENHFDGKVIFHRLDSKVSDLASTIEFAPFYLVVENGEIISKNAILAKNRKLLVELYHVHYKGIRKYLECKINSFFFPDHDNYFIKKLFNFKKVRINCVLLVSASSSNFNYYHFLFDFLPKLLHYKDKFDDIDAIVINGPRPSWQLRILSLLEVNKKIVVMNNLYSIVSKKIYAPSYLSLISHPNRLVVDTISQLKHLKDSSGLSKGLKFLYVSRQAQSSRRILNHQEFNSLLKPYGFEEIRAEEYSFQQQIFLFSNAEIVIGPHGAGLANIVFCQKNTKIIEIKPINFYNDTFENITRILGLEYYSFTSSSIKLNDNMVVNLDQFSNLLRRMINTDE